VILADTSAWVEYDRATGSPAHLRVRELIESDGPLRVTDPVVMEVAAGARAQQRETDLRRLLGRFETLAFHPGIDFDAAVDIYRDCRTHGVTPRGLIDCMIAAVARRHGAVLLAHDGDLDRLARVVGIPLDPASLRVPDR
jgi:hypothetical protein